MKLFIIFSIIIVLVIISIILYLNQNKIVQTNNYISTRSDRYGANAIPYISFIYLCNISNVNLYHNCDEHCEKFKNNINTGYLHYYTIQ